jgi:hypothetical protein
LEPTTSSGIAFASVATGTLTMAGSLFGIPAEAVLSSVVGAGIAMGRAPKAKTSVLQMKASLVVFFTGISTAIFLGPFISIAIDAFVNKFFSIDLPDAPMRVGVCFLVSMGAQRWLPLILERISSDIARKEPQ